MFLIPTNRQLSELTRSFDRMFDEPFESFFAPVQRPEGPRSPALDVSESGEAFTVKLDLPGVKKEDVKVSIDGRRVSVEAKTMREEEKKEGDKVVYRERAMSSWARSFTLPADVSEGDAVAKLENGVLSLLLPKRAPVQTRQLKVS